MIDQDTKPAQDKTTKNLLEAELKIWEDLLHPVGNQRMEFLPTCQRTHHIQQTLQGMVYQENHTYGNQNLYLPKYSSKP